MAKKGDQPTIKVEPRLTDGKRNGFLAEEENLDRRALFRLGTWGFVAVGAVTIAVLANQSSMKLQRNEAAAADLARQSQQLQALTKESQNETRRLAAAINTLDNDRDRLFARVTVLEQGLDSVTGSISRQSSSKVMPQSPAFPAAILGPPPSPTPQSIAESPASMPSRAPEAESVATTAPTPPEKPIAEANPAEPPAKAVAAAAPRPPQPVAATTPAPQQNPAPLIASKSMIGPPEPATQKPIEPQPAPAKITAAPAPQLVASAAPEEKKTPDPVQAASPAIAVKRTEFGVDLGGANSVPGLRALWRGLVKTRANASLLALQPIIVIREGSNGLGMQLRLVAGPFNDAATAAKICAGLAEHQRPCETTVYDGQRLTLKPGDEPAVATIEATRSEPAKFDSAKPEAERSEPDKSDAEKSASDKPVRRYYSRHRYYPKKLQPLPPPTPAPPPPPVAQEPPKPEPTTFSSFFGRHTQAPTPPTGNGP
jgi:hypothetical protein